MKLKEAVLLEKKWSGKVDTEWSPKEGFFTQSAKKIASGLKRASKDLKQAMSRLNFFINRAGSKLKDKAKFDTAKAMLRAMYENESLDEARKLSIAQKKLLDIASAKGITDYEDLPFDIHEKLVALNDYETMWQDANRYLTDKYFEQQIKKPASIGGVKL